LEQDYKNRKTNIINFAMNCSDYITVSEAFNMPYEYRELLYDAAKKRIEEMNKRN